MKKNQTIEELMRGCLQYFEHQSFSQPRIDRYQIMWNKGIVRFMVENNIQHYDASVGEQYILTHIGRGNITPSQRDFIRSIFVLNEFQQKGTIRKRRCHPDERKLSGPIGLLMEQFLMDLELQRRRKNTINGHRVILHRFLLFLVSKGVINVNDIRENHLYLFVSTLTNNNVCIVSSLRLFCKYLFENHIHSSDLSDVLRHYKWNKKEKLPSVYSAKEIRLIESSIKRSDATGKRNYAMMLLATRLGLRASDIASLNFENINWENSCITFSQFKTDKIIELPLLKDVGNAIIDYLKYGRKKSDRSNVFLHTRAPFTSMTGSSVSNALGRVIESSRVDIAGRKHGPHAMRHSLASRFLENKESIAVISEALGHQSTDTTNSYLRIDIDTLRQCSLDVPHVSEAFYVQKGGVFYER